jgi:hypothetical protein
MKYNIFKYSQRAACEFVKEVTDKGKTKTIRLDITDLAILSWFSDFYPSMWKASIDGTEYAVLVHSKLRDDMPILGISKEGCRARMEKLVEFGILTYECIKGVLVFRVGNKRVEKSGTFSLYTFGPNYMRLVDDGVQGQTNGGCGVNHDRGMGSNPYGVQGQTGTKDSSTKDSSTNDSSTKSVGQAHAPKKKAKRETESIPPTLDEVRSYCEERHNGIDAQYFIDYYEARGWKYSKGLPVKSWKACIRTWERNGTRYDKPSKKDYTQNQPKKQIQEHEAPKTVDDYKRFLCDFYGATPEQREELGVSD